MPTVDQINAVLPQTQCGQCGYQGCKPYAEAIFNGEADINQCPPGGDIGINELANLLGVNPKPLNPNHGHHKPRQVAFIREEDCIGCFKCVTACPVDAIIGAPKWLHTVLENECTGCELCISPCPVDCIELHPRPELSLFERQVQRNQFRHRYEAKVQRQQAEALLKAEKIQKQKQALLRAKGIDLS